MCCFRNKIEGGILERRGTGGKLTLSKYLMKHIHQIGETWSAFYLKTGNKINGNDEDKEMKVDVYAVVVSETVYPNQIPSLYPIPLFGVKLET